MGYNDFINEVDRDPKKWWEERIRPSIASCQSMYGSHGPSKLIWNQHADFTGMIFVGGNYATVAHTFCGSKHNDEESQLAIIRDFLRTKGYSLRRLSRKAK